MTKDLALLLASIITFVLAIQECCKDQSTNPINPTFECSVPTSFAKAPAGVSSVKPRIFRNGSDNRLLSLAVKYTRNFASGMSDVPVRK